MRTFRPCFSLFCLSVCVMKTQAILVICVHASIYSSIHCLRFLCFVSDSYFVCLSVCKRLAMPCTRHVMPCTQVMAHLCCTRDCTQSFAAHRVSCAPHIQSILYVYFLYLSSVSTCVPRTRDVLQNTRGPLMSHSCVYESFMRVTRLIHVCATTYPCVRHDSLVSQTQAMAPFMMPTTPAMLLTLTPLPSFGDLTR